MRDASLEGTCTISILRTPDSREIQVLATRVRLKHPVISRKAYDIGFWAERSVLIDRLVHPMWDRRHGNSSSWTRFH
jgi:hypothetical protein